MDSVGERNKLISFSKQLEQFSLLTVLHFAGFPFVLITYYFY